jgi:hypothetical protein
VLKVANPDPSSMWPVLVGSCAPLGVAHRRQQRVDQPTVHLRPKTRSKLRMCNIGQAADHFDGGANACHNHRRTHREEYPSALLPPPEAR